MYYINNGLYSNTRYDMSKFMEFTNGDFEILDSYLCTQIKSLNYVGAITVKANQAYKPDLISWDIYNDTMYWWILMIYNDLDSPMQLEAGAVLVYPSLADLENLYFTLTTKQKIKDITAND